MNEKDSTMIEPGTSTYLDYTEALESLRRSNPEQFKKVMGGALFLYPARLEAAGGFIRPSHRLLRRLCSWLGLECYLQAHKAR